MIYLFLCLVSLPLLAQDFSSKSITTGLRSSYFETQGTFDNTFLYYVPEYQDETFGESFTTRRQFKFRVFDYLSSDEAVIVDPLDVSMEWFTEKHSFQIGFLRYRFSETFGLQLLDVANPRDYSEYVFNDLSWSKRSVFGMNALKKMNNFQIQLMWTLWPNGDRLPYKGTAFDLSPDALDYRGGVIHRPWFKDMEYGARAKYLFSNGLDASLLYYHHFARPTVQDISLSGLSTFTARPTNHMVDSFGSSASYVVGDWVLRGDFLYTLDDLIQDTVFSYHRDDHFQALLGLDRTFGESVLGLQTQFDLTTNRHFFGAKYEKNDISWWKPAIMFFRNYQYDDRWLQIKNRFEYQSFRIDFIYDNIYGGQSEEEVFGFYRDNDRVLVDVSYSY